MKKAINPLNEKNRMKALKELNILDSAPEKQFDDLAQLASIICETPVAMISLVDDCRQWFKSKIGVQVNETDRDISFCSHAILQNEVMEVQDARLDQRFQDNPLVTGSTNIVFYAGAPLITQEGYALGTLCVIDHKPRQLTKNQKEALAKLSSQVVQQIKYRQLISQQDEIIEQNRLFKDQAIENFNLLQKVTQQAPGVLYQFQQFPDGRSCFPYSSKAMEMIYEFKPEQLVQDAAPVFKLIHPEDYQMVVDSIQKSAETLSVWECEYRVNLPLQGTRWRKGHSVPEKLPDGSISWYGFITDITENKKATKKLIQSQKMAALGEMSAGVGHEINNPLAILIGRFNLLKRGIKTDKYSKDEILESLTNLESVVHRISKIVKSLKAFSQSSEHEDIERVNLAKIANDALDLCQDKIFEFNIELRFKISYEQIIECRPVQLTQVFVNLILNSIYAIKDLDKKWIELESFEEGDTTKILVTDSGLGLPKEISDKIMQPFFTTKAVGEGSGLGLSISKGIVEELGGELTYLEICPQTTFLIEIPTKQARENQKISIHKQAV